jgi:integrase
MVAKFGKLAGIAKLHPHRLRHTFATRFLTNGLGDTLQLQQFLGHTSLEMVRRYVAFASVERALLERRPSPMDILGDKRQSASDAYVRRVQGKKPRGLRLVR